jgi:dolichol-phosphate mannosyltransferase
LSPKILAFTPTYNEAGNIPPLITALLALPLDIEVLVVDDQSPDGTGAVVADLAAADARVHLVSRPPPRGRGLAGRDGFQWFIDRRQYDFLVEMDADFSHHPKFIPALVSALATADVAIGSRYIPGGCETGRGSERQLTSRLANAYLRFTLQTRQRDCTSGFRGYHRRAFDGVCLDKYTSVGPPIVSEVLFDMIRRRRRIVEVPIVFEDRRWGESKLSLRILLQALGFPLFLRWAYLGKHGIR